MCGIGGLLTFAPVRRETLETAARAMGERMVHRGPDAGAVWSDPEAGIALVHRRLSILDLREVANQPMVRGAWRIVFNGEIYNFAELRAELAALGERFETSGDTEVILAACSRWGVERAVSRFVGMFAFALWEERARRLWLVRDRLGIKPLYVGRLGGRLLFASELSALLAGRPADVTATIAPGAVAAFLENAYVPGPETIVTEVRKLPPGSICCIDASGVERESLYWDAYEIASCDDVPPIADLPAAVEQLEALAEEAVRLRLIADVPLGAFLSGGVDSSYIAALMARQASGPVKTFSVGFEDPRFDEAPFARAVAEQLGSEHVEVYVGERDLLALAPGMPGHFDEPFADSSQIPMLLISRIAREQVKVCLSGDGGDELFAGYSRYQWALKADRLLSGAPYGLRRALMPVAACTMAMAAGIPGPGRAFTATRRARLLQAFGARDWEEALAAFGRVWLDGLPLGEATRVAAPALRRRRNMGSVIATASLDDLTRYMPDDILVKVDRASMAVSLEARVPLIDHRLVEFALRLPVSLKTADGKTKLPLRHALWSHIPKTLVERPKKGFSVPMAGWLRGPLRDWAEELLSPATLASDGLLDAAALRRLWDDHQAGRADHHHALWAALMLQGWRRRFAAEARMA